MKIIQNIAHIWNNIKKSSEEYILILKYISSIVSKIHFFFSVSNDGNTKFWIDKFSGDIVLINPLDFESFQNYIVTYVAADHGNLKVKTWKN